MALIVQRTVQGEAALKARLNMNASGRLYRARLGYLAALAPYAAALPSPFTVVHDSTAAPRCWYAVHAPRPIASCAGTAVRRLGVYVVYNGTENYEERDLCQHCSYHAERTYHTTPVAEYAPAAPAPLVPPVGDRCHYAGGSVGCTSAAGQRLDVLLPGHYTYTAWDLCPTCAARVRRNYHTQPAQA